MLQTDYVPFLLSYNKKGRNVRYISLCIHLSYVSTQWKEYRDTDFHNGFSSKSIKSNFLNNRRKKISLVVLKHVLNPSISKTTVKKYC